jgi:hypothetical protein
MREIEEMPYKEIADITGMPTGTAIEPFARASSSSSSDGVMNGNMVLSLRGEA